MQAAALKIEYVLQATMHSNALTIPQRMAELGKKRENDKRPSKQNTNKATTTIAINNHHNTIKELIKNLISAVSH